MIYDKTPIYYVYVYLDPRKQGEYIYQNLKFDYEPFYIGKGTGLRMYSHLCCKDPFNIYKNRKIKKLLTLGLDPIIIKHKEGLGEKDALDLEVELIKVVGRTKTKTGPLLNLTEGGVGGSCDICKTKEFSKKMSNIWQQWIKNNPEKQVKRIQKASESRRKNILLGITDPRTFLGKKHTKEAKEKIGKANSLNQRGERNSQYGTCWVHNLQLEENKKIPKEELNAWLEKGWVRGRKRTLEKNYNSEKMHEHNKDRCWVANPATFKTKHIKKNKLQEFLLEGWLRGRKC